MQTESGSASTGSAADVFDGLGRPPSPGTTAQGQKDFAPFLQTGSVADVFDDLGRMPIPETAAQLQEESAPYLQSLPPYDGKNVCYTNPRSSP